MGEGGRGEGRAELGVPQPQGESVAPVQSPGMHPPEGLYIGVLIPCPAWMLREETGLKQRFPSYLASCSPTLFLASQTVFARTCPPSQAKFVCFDATHEK